MKVTVLMSSGDEDEWEDVHDALVEETGMLVVVGKAIETDEGEVANVTARYAPGMWMRVEYDQ